MKTVNLTVEEILQINAELVGTEKQSGILTLKMNMLTKFRLSKLYKAISDEISIYEKINVEMFEKYGEQNESGYSIPHFIEEDDNGEKVQKYNPKLKEYFNELNPILKEVKEIEFPEITIEDFKDAETEGYFPLFFEKILAA